MKILLGVDFSRDAEAAVRFLSGLRFPTGSELVLSHIVKGTSELKELSHVKNVEEGLRRIRQHAHERATNHLHRLQEKFIDPALTTQIIVKEGNPGEELLFLAAQKHIDLAVLGTRGISGLTRFLLGSVSEWILHEASCSVLVVRGQTRWLPKGLRVLLATDGSSEAQAALKFVNQLNFPADSHMVVFHVVEPRDFTVVQDDYEMVPLGNREAKEMATINSKIQKRLEQLRKSYLSKAKQDIHFKNVKAEHVSTGFAAEEILKAAKRFRSDLIVLGSRGLSGFKRTILGSVSRKVVRHAHCSVLVVRKS